MTDSREQVLERLVMCEQRRAWLDAQHELLRQEIVSALRAARRVGIPTSQAARIAGLSRSHAYACLAEGGDDAQHRRQSPS